MTVSAVRADSAALRDFQTRLDKGDAQALSLEAQLDLEQTKQVIAAISNAEINLGDEFTLVLIRFDGTNWTQPVAMLADTRAEFAPQVVFDGNGDAIAVWERVADPDFNTMDLGAFAAELEIVTARWDHDAKVWTEPEPLTSNRYLDNEPLLCGPTANGDVLLVWTQSTANQLMGTNTVGTAGNSDVLWRQWRAAGQSWSVPGRGPVASATWSRTAPASSSTTSGRDARSASTTSRVSARTGEQVA